MSVTPRLAEFWIRHSKSALLGAVALVLCGVWASLYIPLEWIPSLSLPQVAVSASWPAASPRAIERSIAAPLERALQGVPGTTRVESYSQEGQAFVRLEVSEERDLSLYVAELSDHLAALRSSLPQGVVPRISREVPEAFKNEQGFMTLQLLGSASPEALRKVAEEVVTPKLRSLVGVAGVTIQGGDEWELLISIKEDRLRAHHLTVEEVRQRLAEAFSDRSYGWLRSRQGQALLLSSGQDEAAKVAKLVITGDSAAGLVRLSDIARLSLGPAPVQNISRIDGKPVIALSVNCLPGSHLLEVAAAVRRTLGELAHDLPWGVELLVADDRTENTRRQLWDLAVRSGLGLLAILVVLLAMLRSGRAAGIVLFSVAVVLSVAVTLFHPLGLTLNILTLAGLGLLVGLLAANAIIVIEQLLLKTAWPGRVTSDYTQAVLQALGAVGPPLLGGTLSTVAVLLPLVYLSGELRSLFAPFAVVAALTLGFSLLSAVSLIPILGQYLAERTSIPTLSRRSCCWSKVRRLAIAPYHFATHHPGMALLLLFLAIGLPTPLLPDSIAEPAEGWGSLDEMRSATRYNETLGSSRVHNVRRWLDVLLGGVTRPFLEEVELGRSWNFERRPEVTIRIELPAGSGIERSDELIQGFEQRALGAQSVRRTITHVGENVALVRVLFHKEAMETDEPYILREDLIRQALQFSGVEVAISGLVPLGFYSGLGDVSDFTVEAYGSNYEKLERTIAIFAKRLQRYPRVAEVNLEAGHYGEPEGREVLRFHWGSEAVARTGMNARDLADLLRSYLLTLTPSFHTNLDGAYQMPVRFITEGAEGQDITQLQGYPLAQGSGGSLHLAGTAKLTAEREPAAIERANQQYKRYLQVFYRGPYHMGKKMIDDEIQTMRLSPGYRLEQPKSILLTEKIRRELFWLIAGTVGLVFLVVAAVLESWSLAGMVMLGLPLAWIGIALGFLVTGENFTEGAFLGVVLTIGLSVSANILLADQFRRLRLARPSMSAPRLALLALRNRLRPMWTTTLVSVAGMLPLLILPEGNQFWMGLALSVVGGLLSSTLLAPAAILALLSWRWRTAVNKTL